MHLFSLTTHKNRILYFVIVVFAFVVMAASCGGGGGGGGGGSTADTTPPSILFSSPDPSGTLSFKADPAVLPQSISVSYSDASGITSTSFSSAFTFRGQSLDITRVFSAGASSASTGSNTSPLYWTVLARYDMTTDTLLGTVPVFGVSSGSAGRFNLAEIDDTGNLLYVAATSRNKLLYINLATGATLKEVSLPGKPTIIRACPSQGKIYVAFENSATIYVYSSAGAALGTIAMPATPWNMVINRTTATAYVIFSNSTAMSVINCATDIAVSTALGNIPQVIATDGLSTGRVYYAGGLGAARGIYFISGGVETQLTSLAANPEDLAYDASSHRLFAADFDADSVAVYNAGTGSLINNTGLGPISQAPFTMRASPQSTGLSKMYVLNKDSDTVSVLNTANASVSGTINLAAEPVGLAVDGVGKSLYVLLNLWDLQASEQLKLQSTIRDTLGNANTASVTLSIQPDVTGGGAPPARIISEKSR
jgi:YVTN family beta-propeller protein